MYAVSVYGYSDKKESHFREDERRTVARKEEVKNGSAKQYI
jgi:hypothetical protein